MYTTLGGVNRLAASPRRIECTLSHQQILTSGVGRSVRRRQAGGIVRASQTTQQSNPQAAAASSLRLAVAAHEIPHPAKVAYGGEDAFFISEQGSTAFGVADGVGGWANSGVNPAEYSKTLMREAKAHFEDATLTSALPETDSTASDQRNSTDASSSSASDGASANQTIQKSDQHLERQPTSTSQTDASEAQPSSSNDSSNAAASPPSTSDSATSYSNASTSAEHQVSTSASRPLSPSECDPQTALAAAHKATKQPGSSTALILQLQDGTSTLKASNLGDSGFAVFRKGKLIFQSSPLQHFFDCPYQFAACPEFTEDTDRPEDASIYEVQLQSGDVIVAATDGLWDNLHTEELIPLLPTSEADVKQAASKIAKAASNNAFDDNYSSPYTVEAMRQGMDLPWWQKVSGARFKDGKVQLARLQGGKVDDITVVVAYATAA